MLGQLAQQGQPLLDHLALLVQLLQRVGQPFPSAQLVHLLAQRCQVGQPGERLLLAGPPDVELAPGRANLVGQCGQFRGAGRHVGRHRGPGTRRGQQRRNRRLHCPQLVHGVIQEAHRIERAHGAVLPARGGAPDQVHRLSARPAQGPDFVAWPRVSVGEVSWKLDVICHAVPSLGPWVTGTRPGPRPTAPGRTIVTTVR
jgi:hypothetical protein